MPKVKLEAPKSRNNPDTLIAVELEYNATSLADIIKVAKKQYPGVPFKYLRFTGSKISFSIYPRSR
jgi:hypothetical protein